MVYIIAFNAAKRKQGPLHLYCAVSRLPYILDRSATKKLRVLDLAKNRQSVLPVPATGTRRSGTNGATHASTPWDEWGHPRFDTRRSLSPSSACRVGRDADSRPMIEGGGVGRHSGPLPRGRGVPGSVSGHGDGARARDLPRVKALEGMMAEAPDGRRAVRGGSPGRTPGGSPAGRAANAIPGAGPHRSGGRPGPPPDGTAGRSGPPSPATSRPRLVFSCVPEFHPVIRLSAIHYD